MMGEMKKNHQFQYVNALRRAIHTSELWVITRRITLFLNKTFIIGGMFMKITLKTDSFVCKNPPKITGNEL